jgi:hypothetical protein
MHSPQVLSQLVQQHQADARRSAARARASQGAGAPRRAAMRNRAGWTLVQIGLRLATNTVDA